MSLNLKRLLVLNGLIFGSLSAVAAPAPSALAPAAARRAAPNLSEQLSEIRNRVLNVERGLISGMKEREETQGNLKRLQELMKLQAKERELTQKRLHELQLTVDELALRRNSLRERVGLERAVVRDFLKELNRAATETPLGVRPDDREKLEAARRKLLSALAERGLKEFEALKVDLADADQLEGKIEEESSQLTYLVHDLKEQESMLEFNRLIHLDVLQKHHAERLGQLESYRKLKDAESQVSTLIGQFNSRRELEKAVETEREATRAAATGAFGKQKGSLPLPLQGPIVSQFGKGLDPVSQLQVFHKGVEIDGGKSVSVRAISDGKVAFSGELPSYGRVTILDHGGHYYSLCANLGALARKEGEIVKAGEELGTSEASGKPVYFEIRARNLPVDPLEWIAHR